jgi:Raf kinase inhibitor-like YbhB/YbcL family protein
MTWARVLLGLCCLLPLVMAKGGDTFRASSPAFHSGAALPASCSRAGGNQSPPLVLSGMPSGTQSIALLMDDPDAPAGDWVHWIAVGVPPTTTHISAGRLPAGAVLGANSWGAVRYDGPQPPSGTHRYVIHLYALDAKPHLDPGFTKADFDAAIKGHVLAEATLEGTFSAAR